MYKTLNRPIGQKHTIETVLLCQYLKECVWQTDN